MQRGSEIRMRRADNAFDKWNAFFSGPLRCRRPVDLFVEKQPVIGVEAENAACVDIDPGHD